MLRIIIIAMCAILTACGGVVRMPAATHAPTSHDVTETVSEPSEIMPAQALPMPRASRYRTTVSIESPTYEEAAGVWCLETAAMDLLVADENPISSDGSITCIAHPVGDTWSATPSGAECPTGWASVDGGYCSLRHNGALER